MHSVEQMTYVPAEWRCQKMHKYCFFVIVYLCCMKVCQKVFMLFTVYHKNVQWNETCHCQIAIRSAIIWWKYLNWISNLIVVIVYNGSSMKSLLISQINIHISLELQYQILFTLFLNMIFVSLDEIKRA